MSIEFFFKYHQYTIAALSAIGTIAAVMTAIYLARRNEYIRLKANVSVWETINPGEIESGESTIQVSISNIGLRSAWLPHFFFAWKIPFYRKELVVKHSSPERFPLMLAPGRNNLIKLHDIQRFQNEIARISKHLKFLGSARIRWCRAFICTEDGNKIWVKISPPLRKELKKITKTSQGSGKSRSRVDKSARPR